MATCYACETQAQATCPRCGRAFCPEHGADICARCADPASVAPGRWLYRGSALALLITSVVGVWLLIAPPDTSGTNASEGGPEGPIGATAAAATSTALPGGSPTATAGGEARYTVKPGDTLADIARQFNTTADAIQKANGLTSDIIQIGQELKIPR